MLLDNLINEEEDKESNKEHVDINPYEVIGDEKGIPSTRQLKTNNSKKMFDPGNETEEAKNTLMNGSNTDRMMMSQ